jgi:hypothetical protein
VLRNGDPVADCAVPGSGSAEPSPCVESRETLDDGDVRVRVLTVDASTWVLRVRTGPSPQDVTFAPIPDATYGDGPLTLEASASSDLPIEFAAEGPCSLDGHRVVLTGAGECAVTASQPGTEDWLPAEPVTRRFVIARAALRIRADDQTKVIGAEDPLFTVSYHGLVGDDVPGDLRGELICSTPATAASPVGTYPIVCEGLRSPDYAITWVDGTLRVTFARPGACADGPGHQVLQPVNVNGTSVFKHKSTVPVKFRVCDALGTSLGPDPAVVQAFRLVATETGTVTNAVDEAVESTTPSTEFRWDETERLWVFNIGTRRLEIDTTYRYRIVLVDGTAIEFAFGLR